ncbi:MAG TPA: GMC family oxidoreductase [Mycobacteriales bacterium]|jgi:choline dehydrogenase-like flavoprotein|nr:GMC family oxidoreductase [Mycobacteriales bacterium]
MPITETADVVVIGTGPGGAIPGFHLAAGGAKVVFLERGPWLKTQEFTHDLQLGTYTKLVDYVQCDGVNVIAGNCVGGSSVIYYAAALRAPSFVFERHGLVGRRLWPRSITRSSMDKWYDRAEETLPVAEQTWNDVTFAGGVWASLCHRAGRTCNPVPVAVDLKQCTNCGWMLNGCRFDAKRSMLLNYLPAALAHNAEIRPLCEVQTISPASTSGYRYRVEYSTVNAADYRQMTGGGSIEAKIVILAAGTLGTPVILQRSAQFLGAMPDAVGKHFSPNGDHVTMAVLDEDKVRNVLGLQRDARTAYEAFPIGKPISSMTFDYLDEKAPEFDRFSLQQIFFPAIVNVLPEDTQPGAPSWFGLSKRELTRRWRSWINVLAMTEDGNEGVFGQPPVSGSFTRLASAASLGQITYRPTRQTLRGWKLADERTRHIVEHEGVGRFLEWSGSPNALTAHPLSSCRIGDDPALSACDDRHELRGHPGIFVTDGASVPTSLCVNPSLTIAALAERAAHLISRRAASYGVQARPDVPAPQLS